MGDRPARKEFGHGPGQCWPFLNTSKPRITSPGRVTKSTETPKPIKSAAAIFNTPKDVVDTSKLHANYCPRSPIQTRGKSAQAGSQQQQQQSIASSSGKIPSTPVPTSNTFDVLPEDNGVVVISSDDDDDDDDDQTKVKVTNPSASEAKAQNKKQLPIVIPDYSGAAVWNLLSRADCDCEIKILRTSVRVVTLNRPSFEKVKTLLVENKINFYTFDSPDKVAAKIVLTGYISVTIPQLKRVLADHDIFPREVRVLTRTESVTGEHVLYLLLFDRGTMKLQDLRKIKSLDGFVVNWRYFTKRPTDAAQCHRCQRFGHGSRNCSMTPKCVKC